jgi:hypothetical protein
MNRKQRRAAAARKRKVGDVIHATTIAVVDDVGHQHLYWFETPEGFRPEDGLPPGATLHGPFATEAEVAKHQRVALLGQQCEISEGGAWDPNWGKAQ